MKNSLRSFTTFNGKERLGILLLSLVLMILIFIRGTMRFWVHPDFNEATNKRLAAKWDSFKKANAAVELNDSILATQQTWLDRTDGPSAPIPDPININTSDSATLVRLKGIGPVTAGKLIRWRKEHGAFRSIDDILEIHHIPDSTFGLIKKHLVVN